MKNLLLITFLLSSGIMSSQSNTNCEKILSKEIILDKKSPNRGMMELDNAAKNLIGCGIDSLDYYILFESMIISLSLNLSEVVDINEDRTIITHAQLLQGIEKIKEGVGYKGMRKFHETRIELASRSADIMNWEKDKLLFEEIGKEKIELYAIYEILKEFSDPRMTYKEFFEEYSSRITWLVSIERDIIYNPKIDSSIIDYYRLSRKSFYSSIYSKSKEIGKPILFYLTGFENISAREMEKIILGDERIWETISEQFIFLPLFIDDETRLDGFEISRPEFRDKNIRTIGERNIELQKSKFNQEPMPLFVIACSDEEIIGNIGYTLDKLTFIEFLTKGLENKK